MRDAVEQVVRAAGGLVIRVDDSGRSEIAVVHRPHRSDWSFPKGKLEPGESLEEAALREVEEETGLRCRLVARVATIRYFDSRGRPKAVTYWTMKVLDGTFEVNDEVDELRWTAIEDLDALLSYDSDRKLVGELKDRIVP